MPNVATVTDVLRDPMPRVRSFASAVRDAGTKIADASRRLVRAEGEAKSWLSRVIAQEIAHRARTRTTASWDELYPELTAEQRAEARIQRTLTRATIAGVASAAGASAAELATAASEGWATPIAVPLGLAAVGADVLYTTVLQVDLAFDLASIYGVPFAEDDVGEIATLLALPLGVRFAGEPEPQLSRPSESSAEKPWRSVEAMYRSDFTDSIAGRLVAGGVLRDTVPIAGIFVSAVVSQLYLRRFAQHVHAAMRHRAAIARACRRVRFEGDAEAARTIVEGGWLMATGCGPLGHEEALALSISIDALGLPARTATDEASFEHDEDGWLAKACALEAEQKDVLLDVLVLVASADGALETFERRFLRRVSRALGRELDLFAVERRCARLREGEAAGAGDGADRASFAFAPGAR